MSPVPAKLSANVEETVATIQGLENIDESTQTAGGPGEIETSSMSSSALNLRVNSHLTNYVSKDDLLTVRKLIQIAIPLLER
jgi:hypothetical protein